MMISTQSAVAGDDVAIDVDAAKEDPAEEEILSATSSAKKRKTSTVKDDSAEKDRLTRTSGGPAGRGDGGP
jgi:hypothetical protein